MKKSILIILTCFSLCLPAWGEDRYVSTSNELVSAIRHYNNQLTADTDPTANSIIFTTDVNLSEDLPPITVSYMVDGRGHTIHGEGHRGFSVIGAGVRPAFKNLRVRDMLAQGGLGGNRNTYGGSGGGGLGAGGGILVTSGAQPSLENVTFSNCIAHGGTVSNEPIKGPARGALYVATVGKLHIIDISRTQPKSRCS